MQWFFSTILIMTPSPPTAVGWGGRKEGKIGTGKETHLFVTGRKLKRPTPEVLAAFTALSPSQRQRPGRRKDTRLGVKPWDSRMSSDTSSVNPGKSLDFSTPYPLSVWRWSVMPCRTREDYVRSGRGMGMQGRLTNACLCFLGRHLFSHPLPTHKHSKGILS